MKIKFAITLSRKTVRGFEAEGYDGGRAVRDAIVARVQELLDEMNDAGDDADEVDEEDDDA